MDIIEEDFIVGDAMDKFLVNFIEKHPSLHDTNFYTDADEVIWNDISAEMGIQSKINIEIL